MVISSGYVASRTVEASLVESVITVLASGVPSGVPVVTSGVLLIAGELVTAIVFIIIGELSGILLIDDVTSGVRLINDVDLSVHVVSFVVKPPPGVVSGMVDRGTVVSVEYLISTSLKIRRRGQRETRCVKATNSNGHLFISLDKFWCEINRGKPYQ